MRLHEPGDAAPYAVYSSLITAPGRTSNLCLQGGATRFDMLNLAVQPQKGKALLFFPAFADGTSDPRSVCFCLSVRCCRPTWKVVLGGHAAADFGLQCQSLCNLAVMHSPEAGLHRVHLTITPLLPRRSLHTAEDAAEGNTKWVTQQWVARGLSSAAADPIQAALSGSLPLGSAAAAPSAAQPARRAAAADDGPSAAEALLAGKRGKGKKGGKKQGGGGGGGKGFGA